MRIKQMLTVVLLILTSNFSMANEIQLHSGTQKNQLVELYTSEGCSSCPVADEWMSKLEKRDDLWVDVIPIAFHVDYWDQLGWKDELARKSFSDRQRQYRQEGQISQVYTPGFVIDGQEWRGFFKRQSLKKANSMNVGEISAQINDQSVSAVFTPESHDNGDMTFHIAILGFDISKLIKAGENSGKTLKHNFAVIGYGKHTVSIENNSYTAKMDLPNVDAKTNRKAVVMWVSETSSQTPVQVVGNWL